MAVKTAPHREIAIRTGPVVWVNCGNMVIVRKSPYAPSLRSTLARIMDPATGASTWAFGSHRCVMYMGIFTRNATVSDKLRMRLVGE